jgi:arginyl-tRNA synthetase
MPHEPIGAKPHPLEPADPVSGLKEAIAQAICDLWGPEQHIAFSVERPRKTELGDYSTNAAMVLAPRLGQPPRDVGSELAMRLISKLEAVVDDVQCAGPGFVNLFMADRFWHAALSQTLHAGERYGVGQQQKERILIEFVSANPTGPLTVASGRHAAYGDALCRILSFCGHQVEREYYVNDYGSQIERLGESIRARACGGEPPADGYKGSYVTEISKRIDQARSATVDELARRGIEFMISDLKTTLERFRVSFDSFFSERWLHESGELERVVAELDRNRYLYTQDEALWLRSSAFSDDKDRVLRRSSNEFTYFASDIAYHQHKQTRDFDRYLDIWGADHHGYVGRVQAAWQALGGDSSQLELVIIQLVNLLESGQRVQMSKREGEFVTLDDLIDDIGVDAARFFLVDRSSDSTLDLDLALARQRTQDNPVFYIQYAHARIASILAKAGADRVALALEAVPAPQPKSLHPSERLLLARILEFPGELSLAASRRAPHRLSAYVLELSQQFSAFYRDCRVVGATDADEDFRIALTVQCKRVIQTSLELLGVSAPEQM